MDKDLHTALMEASEAGRLSVIDLLIKAGSVVDARVSRYTRVYSYDIRTLTFLRIIIIVETSSWCSTASGECVSDDFFQHSIDDGQTSCLTQVSGPSLNAFELLVIHNSPCQHSSKLFFNCAGGTRDATTLQII